MKVQTALTFPLCSNFPRGMAPLGSAPRPLCAPKSLPVPSVTTASVTLCKLHL